MNLYLSRYRFERQDASELNKLARATRVPPGLEILGNYTIIDKAEGFTLFKADNHKAILDYTVPFRRLIKDFEVVPIEPVQDAYHTT